MGSNIAPKPRDPAEEITLLIDGDTVAFTAASAAQQVLEDEFGFVQPFARRAEGEAIVDNILTGLEVAFKSTHYRIALTDPKENWRRGIWPGYKANRKDTFRPLLLDILKQYLRDRYGAFHWPGLEADDVLGIMATEPQEFPGRRVLVGRDKDYKTVPCSYHRMGDFNFAGSPVVKETTDWEAQRFHLVQTLSGDATDGYPGCPGIGGTRAERIMEKPEVLRPAGGLITRGVNKGNSTTKWVAEPTTSLWEAVVSNYRKGMSSGNNIISWAEAEKAALVTARLAHILRHGDYSRDTGAITLWTPSEIKPL